ncbi:MAG: bifunctional nuclease family protein [Eggerthellaceae bacterium]|jgi:bifunctional DNase/RNase
MVPVSVLTLIMSPVPSPSILVLQPTADVGTNKNSRVVPIWVGVSEATMLGIALEKARFKRPMTHDLFLDALTSLDAFVDHVTIYDVQGPTFYAELVLKARGKLLSLDARPSDAISLALREEAPLYMDDAVLERASFPYLFNEEADDPDQIMADFHNFIEQLTPDDLTEGSRQDREAVIRQAEQLIGAASSSQDAPHGTGNAADSADTGNKAQGEESSGQADNPAAPGNGPENPRS